MDVKNFINQSIGKALDFDGYYGAQCVDLIQYFAKALGTARFSGNAIDIWNQPGNDYIRIANTPSFVPQLGDIACFDRRFGNGFGHVSLCNGVGDTKTFVSLDQNWGTSAGKLVTHNYTGFLGVLRPKKLVVAPAPTPAPAPAGRFVTVTLPNLQVRSAPNTTAPGGKANTPDGMLHAGMVVQVVKVVKGEKVTINGVTSDDWGVSVHNNYFWMGGTK